MNERSRYTDRGRPCIKCQIWWMIEVNGSEKRVLTMLEKAKDQRSNGGSDHWKKHKSRSILNHRAGRSRSLKHPNTEIIQKKRKMAEISEIKVTRKTLEMTNTKSDTKIVIGIKCNCLWKRNNITIHIRNGYIDRIQEKDRIWLKMQTKILRKERRKDAARKRRRNGSNKGNLT